jgi:hypothetical protein
MAGVVTMRRKMNCKIKFILLDKEYITLMLESTKV